jgi:hypothetical protein
MNTSTRFNKVISICLPALLFPVMLMSQTFSETRTETKSFKLKPGTQVQVSNKYGNINVITWEKDSVRFEVTISVQSKQESRLTKIISSIDCEMISTASFISARTVFHDNNATFWKDVVSYAGKVINTGNNLTINYNVYLPSAQPLKIDNKFGNIYMDSRRGGTDLTLANGDLQGRDFGGNLKLKLEFSSASLQDVGNAQFEINYSDISLQNAEALAFTGKSSTLDIERVENLEINSVRDKINLRSCGSINGDASFSRIRINALENNCTLITKYGELRLNGISRNFRNLFVRAEYTDVLFTFNSQASYSMDLIHDAKTSLNITPAISNNLKKEVVNSTQGTSKLSGDIGKAANSQVTVTIKAGSVAWLNK